MRKLAVLAFPLLAMASPAFSADYDGPIYRERNVVIESPPVIERERIVERRYYEPVPVYSERVVVEPRFQYRTRRWLGPNAGGFDYDSGFFRGRRGSHYRVANPYYENGYYGYRQW